MNLHAKAYFIIQSALLAAALSGCSGGTKQAGTPAASPPASETAKPESPPQPAAISAAPPATYVMNGAVLSVIRAKVAAGQSAEYKAALDQLKREADAALKAGPFTVTAKTSVPPSGDKHDYMSMAPYWWPDPSKADGRPYIQKDGQTNPERDSDKYDAVRFGKMAGTVETLALAYYLTGQEPYAVQAGKLLRAWFLDAATKMNPNMNFGQSVPGRADGRKEGVLDSRHFLTTSDAAALLEGSTGWSKQDAEGYRGWLSQYVKWLKENPLALQEKKTANNHSTWYDAILTGLMLHSGDREGAAAYLKESVPKRIASQIDKDGGQPEEMKRTRSFHYPVFNLEAFSMLALYGQKTGFDLWKYETADGKSIKKAFDYLVPYFNGKPWPHAQIKAENEADFAAYLREAAIIYGDRSMAEAADKTLGSAKASSRVNLIAPQPPKAAP
ncbi:hypothetical protein PAESOLCIP111_02125 [Paenibacillus solanacearum]|uniref:Alginate lyase domain-containing protein n=1 Tax=Paenibacillus solanacearum TaxID=2048548 RepID=A0A916JZK1_9BACL|nr:alginate lyase family protein [Paenibacillus solanacearum]CAG7618549.1 hypothetical protein PAESOLCIP111_02125 [Paenibacillus solanacearum]